MDCNGPMMQPPWPLGSRCQVSEQRLGAHAPWCDGVVVRYERNGRPVVAVEGYGISTAASYASGLEVVWDTIRLPRRKTEKGKGGDAMEMSMSSDQEWTHPPAVASPDAGDRVPTNASREPGRKKSIQRRGSSLLRRFHNDPVSCTDALRAFIPRFHRMRGRRRAEKPKNISEDNLTQTPGAEQLSASMMTPQDDGMSHLSDFTDTIGRADGKQEGGEEGSLLCIFAEEGDGVDSPSLCIVLTDCANELFERELPFHELCRLQNDHYEAVPREERKEPSLWYWPRWLEHFSDLLMSSHSCEALWPWVPPERAFACPEEGCRAAFPSDKMLRNHILFSRHRPPSPPSPDTVARRQRDIVTLVVTDRSAEYTGAHRVDPSASPQSHPIIPANAVDSPQRGGKDPATIPQLRIPLRREEAEAWQIRQWVATRITSETALNDERGEPPGVASSPALRRFRRVQGDVGSGGRRPWAPTWEMPWSPSHDP